MLYINIQRNYSMWQQQKLLGQGKMMKVSDFSHESELDFHFLFVDFSLFFLLFIHIFNLIS